MTFQEIQRLIAEIDRLLEADELEPAATQAVLEQVRSGLVQLRNQQAEATPPEPPALQPLEREAAAAIAQAVMAQLNRQRGDWLQPLQQEVETLRQQRQHLIQNLQSLENQQTQVMSNFLQVLLGRCSDSLRRHLARTLQDFEVQLLATQRATLASEGPAHTPLGPGAPLKQLERLEQLRALEQQSDALFATLDRTLHQVFHSLDQDLQGYQQSFSQALARMHDLGQQGEAILRYYLDRLAEPSVPAQAPPLAVPLRVDRERYLLESQPLDRPEPPRAAAPAAAESPPAEPAAPFLYPFAGIEVRQSAIADPGPKEAAPSIPEDEATAVDELLAIDLEPSAAPDPSAQGEAWDAWDEQLFTTDLPPDPAPVEDPEPLVLTPPLPAADEPLPRRWEDALFGGQGDPAVALVDEALEPTAVGELPLEALLFGERPDSAAFPSLGAEADLEDLESVVVAVNEAKATIASLSDLLDQVYQAQAEVAASAAMDEPEDYLPAAANEILLTTEASDTLPLTEWEEVLDDEQMQQLEADLERFEESPAGPAEPPSLGATTAFAPRPGGMIELDMSPFAPLPDPQAGATSGPTHGQDWAAAAQEPEPAATVSPERSASTRPETAGEEIELTPWQDDDATEAELVLEAVSALELEPDVATTQAAPTAAAVFGDVVDWDETEAEDLVAVTVEPEPESELEDDAWTAIAVESEPEVKSELEDDAWTAIAVEPEPEVKSELEDDAWTAIAVEPEPEDEGETLAGVTVIQSLTELTGEPWDSSQAAPAARPSRS